MHVEAIKPLTRRTNFAMIGNFYRITLNTAKTANRGIVKLLPKSHAELIQQAIQAAQAAGDLPQFELPDIVINPAKDKGHGDYASPIALGLAKAAKRKPRDIAEAIVQHLPDADFVADISIAGPGFINFTLSEDYVKQQVDAIIAEGDALFTLDIGAGKRAQVEYVSANPSGPITIGHTRNAVVGDAMARLLAAAGYDVQREYYFNNAGNQMIVLGKSLQARYLQALGEAVELPENGYRGDYLVEFAQEIADEQGNALRDADWATFKDLAETRMFAWIQRSLEAIDIRHDAFFNENSLFENGAIWDVLAILKANGYAYEAKEWEGAGEEEKAKAADKAPAQWFRAAKFGDEKDRVMVKSDGVPTYTLPDIAYHRDKIQRGFDVMVNVLGADHGQQYRVVQYGVQALGLDPSGIHVIIIQMVKTIRDGQEFKISKRAGIFDTLDDLVDMVGADAIRYHMLARSPSSQLNFDLDEVVKQSNDNPVYYIQNAHVRCCGIAREAEARGLSDDGADISLLGADELRFIRKALELGEVIADSVERYEPHKIAFWAQELAAVFHPIYDNVRALHTEVPADVARARLHFYRAARVVFARVLRLMGMSTPEVM